MGQYANFYASNSGDRVYTPESFEEWLRPFFCTGVFNGGLQVVANGNMTVTVNPGYVNIGGKTKYFEDATTLTLSNASSTLNRIDSIVVRRNDTDRDFTLMVREGSQSLSPVPVDPVRAGGIYDLVLAHVYVGAATAQIVQANITDQRADPDLCGWVTSTVEEIDFSQIAAQLTNAFNLWFDSMKGQLSTDAAGNLQLEIDDLATHDMPTGGTAGQILKKTSATDYDTEWGDSVVDDALSSTSTNAVQNSVIKAALDQKANASDLGTQVTYTLNGAVLTITEK